MLVASMATAVLPLVPLVPLVAASKVELPPQVHHQLLHSGRPQVGLWKALLSDAQHRQASQLRDSTAQQQTFTAASKPKYEALCFEQPISHFDDSVNGTFCQRYWLDASSYKPGGPVYLLDGGETSGANRLEFLEKGILEILSNATNGLSVVLEHRYYGDSVPVSSLSTDDLRFLNNAEALEDSAYFIEHFKPPQSVMQLDEPSALHPNNTPWIYYGGSYAGARAAHMRTQYPDLVWGAIASSAVTHAQVVFPQYYDPIQTYGPEDCISEIQSAVIAIDAVLDMPTPISTILKGLFGLQELEHDDFADVVGSPLGNWQAKNWDPAIGSDEFQNFCDALTAGGAGSQIGLVRVPAEVMNYAKYIKENVVSKCPEGSSIVDCFGTHDDEKFLDAGLEQTWRLWLFQVCTQWGYFMPAPLEGPSIISKYLTIDYTSKICRQAYPPGKHFTVPDVPDVDEVNARGDYTIEADRLAFIDGDRDPWRPMTPQSDVAPRRSSTVNRPLAMIFDGVHHYDENGLRNHALEPARIRDVHEFETSFIQEWLAQWEDRKKE
ncbi:hypothetical protein EHS25_000289 [Saitozyma podzolica]|uniref:Thymus-specific serine protease n=1 Tax=Saitozyma podzolica TaxID=1890683 RepID=A0A427YVP0_9TREE|nr:hypothetical protein EHS25_000289 [Saitozyma podzolica]